MDIEERMGEVLKETIDTFSFDSIDFSPSSYYLAELLKDNSNADYFMGKGGSVWDYLFFKVSCIPLLQKSDAYTFKKLH